MKTAHKIKVSVFVKPEENDAHIKDKFISLFPFDLGKEKIEINQINATGFKQREIKIYEAELNKNRHINDFLRKLNRRLGEEQKEKLLMQTDSRLDDNLDFFIRLDKGKMLKDDVKVTDSGNCFHIKISIAAFPKNLENAIKSIKQIFK